jgi:uncharacterized protein YndB with AHSA1/START domain
MSESVRREVVIGAAPAEVWEAVIADGWLAERVEIELRPGGEAVFRDGDVERRGWVEEASAPHRLTYWWGDDDDPASRVELTLEPLGGGSTRLRVLEARPLDVLDLVGTPLRGPGGPMYGPAMLARA